jgi:PPK2 family polyphosphate:nucleotide phosphotransferase
MTLQGVLLSEKKHNDQCIVIPGSKVSLDRRDTGGKKFAALKKDAAMRRLSELTQELRELQDRFYAAHDKKILVILQAMDTGGKDSTIRHVFTGINPQGVRVINFKAPGIEELDHDYLWRIHKHTPRKGEIVIFNRSHYEDVLVARVHRLVNENTWKKRYGHINEFERMLSDEGALILKFFLHISKDEQKKRLAKRLSDKKRSWKFDENDLKERKLWDVYMKAYEEAIEKTSTEWAPWRVIPSDRKWLRNLLVMQHIVKAVKCLDPEYPTPSMPLKGGVELI